MSDDVKAKYACVHHGGGVPCGPDGECRGARTTWIAPEGAKVKRYSPATPKGSISSGLPASIGIGLLDVYETARRRLNGLEPWPIETFTAPRLSKLGKAMTDARVTLAYRELIAAIVKSGGVPSYPIAAQPRRAKAQHRTRGRAQHPQRKTKDHGAAARKAWATRHARNDNGSASALKAWVTRRRQAAA